MPGGEKPVSQALPQSLCHQPHTGSRSRVPCPLGRESGAWWAAVPTGPPLWDRLTRRCAVSREPTNHLQEAVWGLVWGDWYS